MLPSLPGCCRLHRMFGCYEQCQTSAHYIMKNILQKALAVREEVFGGDDLHVAIANEDLAYAYYVHEYNSGDFKQAMWVTCNISGGP